MIGQHGGLYGQGNPPTRIELHEIGVADKYLTWGWTNGSGHVIAGPALINIGKQSDLTLANRGRILLVTDCTFRYSRRPWSMGTLNAQYLENLFKFVDLLSKSERDALIVRLHHDHDKDDRSHLDQWQEKFPNIEIDPGKRHLDLVREVSRIDICTTIGTSEIESMSNNRPTLIYLDPQLIHLENRLRMCFQSAQMPGSCTPRQSHLHAKLVRFGKMLTLGGIARTSNWRVISTAQILRKKCARQFNFFGTKSRLLHVGKELNKPNECGVGGYAISIGIRKR